MTPAGTWHCNEGAALPGPEGWPPAQASDQGRDEGHGQTPAGEFQVNSIRPQLEAHHEAFQGPNFQERGGRALAAAVEQAQAPTILQPPGKAEPVLGRSLPGAPLELGHIHIGTAWCTQTGIPLQERAKKQVCLKRGA